ncbi:hypothetical protein GCM10010232_68130 [Streptomyces amakusaensis]|uniref:Uncharacterized protein n=1 Tax=Streptomyces amakusaensis TaxID=67271 RepID=A0ABW0AUL0_9ACTN
MTSKPPQTPATSQHETPHPFTELGLARLMLSHAHQEVAEHALGGISPRADEHAEPGEFVENARRLVRCAEDALRWAVVYERERGSSWDEIGEALGPITRQSAHRRFAEQVEEWREPLDDPETVRLDGTADDERIPYPAGDPDKGAAHLDHWLLDHTSETDSWYGSAQPVSRHLNRHSTTSALMITGKYTARLLRDQLVPNPHRQADAADRHADLLERLTREGGATRETPEWIARDRARAQALRQIPSTGVPWEAMSDPGKHPHPGASFDMLEAETRVLTVLAPFLALDPEDAVLSPGEAGVFNDLRTARGYGDTDEADRIRTKARGIAADLVRAHPHWLNTSEEGWALYDALRAYAAGSEGRQTF